MAFSAHKMKDFYRGKWIVLTGAGGFIGSHLARRLVQQGAEVISLQRPSADDWRIRDVAGALTVVAGTLSRLDLTEIQKKIKSAQVVFHLAAAGVNQSRQDIPAILESNIGGTLQMLLLARAWQVERFVYCGSCFEYKGGENIAETQTPEPVSEYGVSKAAGWMLAHMFQRKYKLPVVSVRPFTAYGPHEGLHRLVPQVVTAALENKKLPLTKGEQTRDFIFVEDVVDGMLAAGSVSGVEGETFNLATGKATSIREMVNLIAGLAGPTSFQPQWGALEYRADELWSLSGDSQKAKARLHWSAATSLKDGLTETITWFKENQHKLPAVKS